MKIKLRTKIKDILFIGAALLTVACTDETSLTDSGHDSTPAAGTHPVGQPVLFTSGNERLSNTRADGVPYMAEDGRFVCTMYYHTEASATDSSPFNILPSSEGGKATTAWLKVNNSVGNSVYWNKEYTAVDNDGLDDLGFDKNATIFYWQNRYTHAFLALADYNKLKSNEGTADGTLKLYPNGNKTVTTQDDEGNNVTSTDPTINVYDLTRGASMSKMTDQPDPILALTIQKPEGSTQEANRVRLYFKHQFSQIQVNLKGAADESATITANQIQKVELLGVSTEGYVVNQLNTDGTVGTVPVNSSPGTMNAASAKEVNLEDFTDEQLASNRWGTSFEMFDMAKGQDQDGDNIDDGYATGYLKSYNAIAFGVLWGIRVTWKEKVGEILHVSTFEVPLTNETTTSTSTDDDDANTGSGNTTTTPTDPSEAKPVVYLRNLQSGMKYVYNLELRRGTLAIIRTEILDWKQHENLVYGTDGTITN